MILGRIELETSKRSTLSGLKSIALGQTRWVKIMRRKIEVKIKNRKYECKLLLHLFVILLIHLLPQYSTKIYHPTLKSWVVLINI